MYRPPKFNKDFINDFADCLSLVTVKYDHLLISGDFNIHVCCESRPLASDFLNLIASFNLIQSVTGPTHEKGHTLDLVLSCGLSLCVDEICDTACISDHMPVIFTTTIPCATAKTCVATRRLRTLNPQTASKFSILFGQSELVGSWNVICALSVEDLLDTYNSTCMDILDSVAPFRVKRIKALVEPWLNDSTRALRRSCRRAERKWNKDRLHVSRGILRDCFICLSENCKGCQNGIHRRSSL